MTWNRGTGTGAHCKRPADRPLRRPRPKPTRTKAEGCERICGLAQKIYTHTLPNGLVLVAEAMDWLESAAFTLLLPAGCSHDPSQRRGLSNLTCDLLQRGCGSRNSREFLEALERLGADHSASVSGAHMSFGAAVLSENLPATLALYADMTLRPHLPSDQLDEARLVCLQELRALEDDLAHKVMQLLRQQHYPDPWGRSAQGVETEVEQITHGDVTQFFQRQLVPRGAILSVAGKIAWPQLKEQVEQLFAAWSDRPVAQTSEVASPGKYRHIEHDSSQTHLGIAFPSVPYGDPDYYQARGAVGILSDGMSSRLFTRVREERGLCYSVYASCHSLKGRGSVLCYAGTSTERAQETLDVTLAELVRLRDGVESAELDRLKARIKSGLIMQQESSASRSHSMASDWYFLGRVQTLDALSRIIQDLSCDSINQYLRQHAPSQFTIVTVGAQKLEVPVGIS